MTRLIIGFISLALAAHAKDSFIGVAGVTPDVHDANYDNPRNGGLYDVDHWERDGRGNFRNVSGNTSGGAAYVNSQAMDGQISEWGIGPRTSADNPYSRIMVATQPGDDRYYAFEPDADNGTIFTAFRWLRGPSTIGGIYSDVDISSHGFALADSHVLRAELHYVTSTEIRVDAYIDEILVDSLYIESGLGAVDDHSSESVQDAAVPFFGSGESRYPGFLYWSLDSSTDTTTVIASHFDDGVSFSNSANPVAIPFTGAHAYYCVENRSQYLALAGTSVYIDYSDHDGNDASITWSTRYEQGIADYMGSPTDVGAEAIDHYTFATVPSNGTIYQIGNVRNSWSLTENEITSGEEISYPDGLLYIPDADYEGTDTFTYTVTDINGTSSAATVEIVVEASNSVTMPFGIPDPGFGIADEPPADPANWPSAEQAGWYYVDAGHGSATDTDNDFGYPDKPRLTIPGNGLSVTPSGGDAKMVIVPHSSAYELRDFSWHRWDLLGSSGNRFWIVGANGSKDRPIISAHTNQDAQEFRINGDYYTFDGIIFDDCNISRRTDAGNGHDYSVFRHCEFRNFRRNANGGSLVSGGVSTSANTLLFGLYVHNNGRMLTDLADERDNHGVVSGSPTNFWYIDSLSHNNAGDTFQAGNSNTSESVYVGRVKGHSDGENHTDIKDHNKIVVSQCDGWDYRTVNYVSSSGGGAQIIYVNDEGVQQNWSYILHNRVWDTNGTGIGSSSIGARNYMIGNIVFHSPEGSGIRTDSGGGEKHIYLNTIHDVNNGLDMFKSGTNDMYVVGNYVGDVTTYQARSVADYVNIDEFDYNAYKAGGTWAWGSNSTPTTGNHAAWESATGFGANDLEAVGDDWTDSGAYDFSIAAGADVIDALLASAEATVYPGLDDMETDLGVTLQDMFGTALPQNTDFDVGAFEFVGGVSIPNAPSSPSATANSSSQITVGWTDNSSDETGFKVYRGTTSGVLSLLGTATANETTFVDTGLTPSTTYYYEVRSYNAAGDSAATSEVSATTDAAGSGSMTATGTATVGTLTQE